MVWKSYFHLYIYKNKIENQIFGQNLIIFIKYDWFYALFLL